MTGPKGRRARSRPPTLPAVWPSSLRTRGDGSCTAGSISVLGARRAGGVPAEAFPGAARTGVPAGVSLRAVGGNLDIDGDGSFDMYRIDEDGTSLDSIDFAVPVCVFVSDVTITRSRIPEAVWAGRAGPAGPLRRRQGARRCRAATGGSSTSRSSERTSACRPASRACTATGSRASVAMSTTRQPASTAAT